MADVPVPNMRPIHVHAKARPCLGMVMLCYGPLRLRVVERLLHFIVHPKAYCPTADVSPHIRGTLYRRPMLLLLPAELLDLIADWLHAEVLSRVCQRLWHSLGPRRYVKLVTSSEEAEERMAMVVGNVRSLRLKVRGLWDPKDGLAVLRRAGRLHTLALESVRIGRRDDEIQAIAAFREAPRDLPPDTPRRDLHTLALESARGSRTDGVQAIAALKDHPGLSALSLNLGGNVVGDSGAQALAAFQDAPALQSLALDLHSNKVGPSGARALAALHRAPGLTALTLDLWNNALGDVGAEALAALKEAPALRTLVIDLRSNDVGNAGAQALALLKDGPALRSLTLDLGWNVVGAEGARALATLKESASLRRLSLNLYGNAMGLAGEKAMAALRRPKKKATLECHVYY